MIATDNRQELEAQYGQVWSTEQLREDFAVEGFCMYLAVVRRNADGVRGTLDFQHSPRFYHSFQPE